MIPLLIAGIALLAAVPALLLVVATAFVGWRRQDRVLRAMQRELAERSARRDRP